MKRQVTLAIVLLPAISSFAYYGEYSSSPNLELPGWVTFMGFLMIAWSILEIILFFKIWGMTNDVKEINHNLFEIAKFIEESHNERANQN